MGRKQKAGAKAKSKKKAKKREALRLKESSSTRLCLATYEFKPLTEEQLKLLDMMKTHERFTGPCEVEDDLGLTTDEEYMLAKAEQLEISEARMRHLDRIKSERFNYFNKYKIFEEEWDELKKRNPDKYKGEYPPEKYTRLPWHIDTEKSLAVRRSTSGCTHKELDAKPKSPKESPAATSDSGNAGEFPHNELDAKPESQKESPTVSSVSGNAA